MKVICPECKKESPLPSDSLPDGTYTEWCPSCLAKFSYVVVGGIIRPWYPPSNVQMKWNGSGKPGGS